MKKILFLAYALLFLALPVSAQDALEFANFDFDSQFGVNQVSFSCSELVSEAEISGIFGESFSLQQGQNGTCIYSTPVQQFDPSSFDPSSFDPSSFDTSSLVPKSASFSVFVSDKLSPSATYEQAKDLYGDYLSSISNSSIGNKGFESVDSISAGPVTFDQASVYFLDSSRKYNVTVVASAPGVGISNVRELARLLDSRMGRLNFTGTVVNDGPGIGDSGGDIDVDADVDLGVGSDVGLGEGDVDVDASADIDAGSDQTGEGDTSDSGTGDIDQPEGSGFFSSMLDNLEDRFGSRNKAIGVVTAGAGVSIIAIVLLLLVII